MVMQKTKLEELKRFLKKKDFVRAAYVFGSYAESRQGPLSDIDFAVFLDSRLNKKEVEKERLSLINRISQILGTDRFDLVIMNYAPLLLKFNIIKNGKVLKSSRERVMLETRIMSDYLDRKSYDDSYSDISLEKISKRGIL